MNHIAKYSLVLLLLCLNSMGVKAQEVNTLSIADITGNIGGRVSLPVNLNNTCHDIVAVQFRLTVPEGISVDSKSAKFGVRTDNHSAVIQKNGNSYTVVVYCAENKTISGNSGQLMTIDLIIGTGFTPGGVYDIELSEVLLGNKQGKNVATGFSSGKLHIADVPDFVVTDVQLEETSYAPNGYMTVSWKVTNQGGLASTGGWSEQVSLVGSGRTQLLGTVYHEEPLTAGATVSRHADLLIPILPGIDGQAKIQVKLVSNADSGEMTEYQGNNTTQSTQAATLSKQLILTVPQTVAETDKTLRCKLSRSGSWQQSQSFSISSDGDSRLSVATSVTIPAGQSSVIFYLTITDDNIVNTNSSIIVQASGNDYDPVTANLKLEDNELPALSLKASKTNVTEGETFQLTVTRNSPTTEPLAVMLTCEDSKHFDFPTLLTIPAGEASVTVDVRAIDDADVYDVLSLAFVASAEQHSSAEDIVILTDNDMPKLTLQLTPSSVSENAGTNAVIGVLRREGNLDSKVTVRLTDDGNGLLTYSQQSLTLKKGESEVKFGLGVTDDLLVNGDREVTLTAAVFVSSCNCYSTDQTAGSVSQKITVLDNDGPTLLVSPSASVFLEGSDGNSLTISRNASFDKALTVTISSDYDGVLHYEHTAVIEAGQTSVTIPVSVDSNNEQGDDHAFTFTVTAQGFTQGTCWSMVSDQSLPDAIIADFTVSAAQAEAESQIGMTIKVKNTGNSLLRKETPISVYLGADAVLQLSTDKILMAGEETTVEGTYTLPAKTGDFSLMAVVNPNKRISELLYTNNSSASVPITIVPCLTATAQADKDIYQQGEAIIISGKATGTKGANNKLEIYLINDDTRQTISATTDANGNYIVNWTPLKGQVGHFLLGACYPGESKREAMDEFDVYGFSLSGFRSTCQFGEGDTYTGRIYITNPGVLPQTNIHVEPQTTSDYCEFTFTDLERLEGGKSASITYTIKGNGITPGYSWQQMPLVIKSNEGATADYRLYYYVMSQRGSLRATTTNIKTTMTLGEPREYPLTIWNAGKGETGTITLALPSIIETVNPRTMPSLASGDSATIVLRFIPTEQMKANEAVIGKLGINCSNGIGIPVYFELTPVSEKKGTLTVDVVDEFTYYTSEAPHVSNAKVKVMNRATKAVVAEGTTTDDGRFAAEMNEGIYTITVDADNHLSQSRDVIVDPGTNNKEEVFLSYDAITYEWKVEETTVDDEYSIETVVKFDTRVPQPVVVVSYPEDCPEPGSIFPITVTNKGFINAKDVGVELSIKGNGYTLEFLNNPNIDVLAPQQSVVFYAKIKQKNAESRGNAITPILIKCVEMDGEAKYTYDCGPYANKREVVIRKKWGHCPSSYNGSGGSGLGGYSGIGNPWGHHGGSYGSNYRYDVYEEAVAKCQEKENLEDMENEEEEPEDEYVPDEEPDETDDCEHPTLNIVLIPNKPSQNGKFPIVHKVYADGNSYRVKLNSQTSLKPTDDCNYTYHWDLYVNGEIDKYNEYGRLLNQNSLEGVVYISPDNYPMDLFDDRANLRLHLTGKRGKTIIEEDVDFVLMAFPTPEFKLVEINGDSDSKAMKGVAADGVSQIKIVLDPSYKKLKIDFDEITWKLAEGYESIGKLENDNSLEDVIYTAPENHPNPTKNVYTISVKVNYRKGKLTGEKTVDIEIIKVPVLLVHGLNSDGASWTKWGGTPVLSKGKEGMMEFLRDKRDNYFYRKCKYSNFQLYALDYRSSNKESFSFNMNKDFIEKGISHLIGSVQSNDYISSKVDVVAHSMGGLLTKLFIQKHSESESDKDYMGKRIHKFITINTPHAGSQLGDFLNDPRVLFVNSIKEKKEKVTIEKYDKDGRLIGVTEKMKSITPNYDARETLHSVYNTFTSPLTKDIGKGAVKDLGVESEAIKNINNNITCNVKCHAVVTAAEGSFIPGLVSWWKGDFVQSLGYEDIGMAFSELYNDRNDWIVPVKSQMGGLSGSQITFRDGLVDYNYCHVASCKNNEIKTVIANLLSEDINNSSVFSNGFKDISPLSFNMPSLDKVYSIYTPDMIGNPEIHLDYETWKNSNQNINNTRKAQNSSSDESYLLIKHTYELGDSLINIEILPIGDFCDIGFSCYYNGACFARMDSDKGTVKLPQKINGNIIVIYEGLLTDGSWCGMKDSIAVNSIGNEAIEVLEFSEDSIMIVAEEYSCPQVLCKWSDGTVTEVDTPKLSVENTRYAYIEDDKYVYGKATGHTNLIASYEGHTCSIPLVVYMSEEDNETEEETSSVCSTVSLKIEQRAVMTRQAFRGTLTVNNGHPTKPITDLKLNIEVRDEDGKLATSHKFQIEPESLSGFVGEKDFNAGWSLRGKESGTATILFIPTKYAAPTEPQEWAFGGSFSYTDPYTGLIVTRDLNPVKLIVKPTPILDFTYFMQRDILGDDPLTEPIEPMEAAEFAIIVNNKGYGSTQNMKMTTNQPQIVDNEKGLAVNFEIISTQMNGQEKTLALGQSMTTDFGTIAPQSQAYAQWWLQSSLLGHFIEYDIKATHVTSHNNPDLSLLDQVTIHELIRGFTPVGLSGAPIAGRAFLVNDVQDSKDLPDEVYFTDATQQHVAVADNVSVEKLSETTYALHVVPHDVGWNYGTVADPTNGHAVLTGIVRQSDGATLPVDNIWQTDRTLRDGKDPLYENRLHFIGEMPAIGDTYLLTVQPKPEVELKVETITGLPEETVVLTDQLKEVTVLFNKPIDASTFTTDDITLTCQSKRVAVNGIRITKISDQKFTLNLTEATLDDGFYMLTIQTANINDTEGFNGSVGKQAIWTQYGNQLVLKIKILPEKSGSVKPSNARYDFGSNVVMNATAAKGYDFECWKLGEEIVSTDSEWSCHLMENTKLTAVFRPKTYKVTVNYDPTLGEVKDGATGIYDYGTELSLKAVSAVGSFKYWTINGEVVENSNQSLVITVTDAIEISAVFVRDTYYQTIALNQGWNWVSGYLKESLSVEPFFSVVDRIVGQINELIRDPKYGMTGDLDAMHGGSSYKIKAEKPYSHTFKGHLYDPEGAPIGLHNGWNWISYPYYEELDIDETIKNAEEGDYLVSQTGFAEYASGSWEGSLGTLVPGMGYIYKSASDKNLQWNLPAVANSRSGRVRAVTAESDIVDIFRYPNTMNVTAQIMQDGIWQTAEAYNLYAFAGEELRGVSQQKGMNHYLTIYGDEPVIVSFVLESAETGETFLADETLMFRNDVVGSRKNPFVMHFNNATGINRFGYDQQPMTIYNLQGILVGRDTTIKSLNSLSKGVYIVNGRKCFIK